MDQYTQSQEQGDDIFFLCYSMSKCGENQIDIGQEDSLILHYVRSADKRRVELARIEEIGWCKKQGSIGNVKISRMSCFSAFSE